VPSAVIASFSYEAATAVLRITFVSGLVYQYRQVPPTVYEGLKNARAKGIYFNNVIKDKYLFQKTNE
jgi:hypothetical protein